MITRFYCTILWISHHALHIFQSLDPSSLNGPSKHYHLTNTMLIICGIWVVFYYFILKILWREAVRIVAAHPECGLRKIVCSEAEKFIMRNLYSFFSRASIAASSCGKNLSNRGSSR